MRRDDWITSRPGWIYLIQAGTNGPIKVGWCVSVRSRIEALQAGNHRPLKVIAKAPWTRLDEARIHSFIAGYRIRGDWFTKPALPLALEYFTQAALSGEAVSPTKGTGSFA